MCKYDNSLRLRKTLLLKGLNITTQYFNYQKKMKYSSNKINIKTRYPFFFGGTKQAILFIGSLILLIGGFIIVASMGLTLVSFTLGTLSIILGILGVQYYSGYYHKWLEPSLEVSINHVEPNAGLDACVNQVKELLAVATKDVLILSGAFKSEFYELESIVQAFQECLQKGVSIKILVGRNVDSNTKRIPDLLKDYFESTNSELRIYHFPHSDDTPAPHFIVVDSLHVRIEDRHQETDPVDKIIADPIRWYDSMLALRLVHAFKSMWNASGNPYKDE